VVPYGSIPTVSLNLVKIGAQVSELSELNALSNDLNKFVEVDHIKRDGQSTRKFNFQPMSVLGCVCHT
jgi:hypothetical protein